MENELITQEDFTRSLTASEIRAQVNLIQEVLQEVMKKDTHFGIIPGCKQPSLYKAGAEKLLMTFRICAIPKVEDLSTDDEVRYRVTAVAKTINSGTILGEGVGECSSYEEKYKWKRASCDEEFEETAEDRRRNKWSNWQGKTSKIKQIRTNKADMANTILKMADKRAYVAVTLKVTAASDIFTQDIEDMDTDLEKTQDTKSPPPIPTKQQIMPAPAPVVPTETSEEMDQQEMSMGQENKQEKQILRGSSKVKKVKPFIKKDKEGKTEAMYFIDFTNDFSVSAFKPEHEQIATQALKGQLEVNYTYTVNGKYFNLQSIEIIGM